MPLSHLSFLDTSCTQMVALLSPSTYIIKSGPAMEERDTEKAPEQERRVINTDY